MATERLYEVTRADASAVEGVRAGAAAFWRFWAAREAARLVKESGAPRPHSPDAIVAAWRFCNCYRELDRGTAWFAARRARPERWRERHLERLLWESVAYRLLNRRETFEAAEAAPTAGADWHDPARLDDWLKWLETQREAGETLFTGRHIVRGLGPYGETMRWLRDGGRGDSQSGLFKVAGLVRAAGAEGPNLKGVCAAVRAIPGVGPFFAWQVSRDLVEGGAVSEDETWALAGPGARRGATLVAADLDGEAKTLTEPRALEVMLSLRDGQDEVARTLGLDRSRWYRAPANLADVEHTLCEFARYDDLRTGRAERAKCGRYEEGA